MEILKGKVQDPGFPDTEVTYLKTDDGKTYFFIENGTLKNGNYIATPVLKEGIGHTPYTSLGLISSNGDVLIPFENKAIQVLSNDLLLVERNKPITDSVVDALNKQNDPLAATELIESANTIKEQVKSVMGLNGTFIFDNQFSEAALYTTDGVNLANNYFSFIGAKDGAYFMSTNVVGSAISKYDPYAYAMQQEESNQEQSSEVENNNPPQDTFQTQEVDSNQSMDEQNVSNDNQQEPNNDTQEQSNLDTTDLAAGLNIPLAPEQSNEVQATTVDQQGEEKENVTQEENTESTSPLFSNQQSPDSNGEMPLEQTENSADSTSDTVENPLPDLDFDISNMDSNQSQENDETNQENTIQEDTSSEITSNSAEVNDTDSLNEMSNNNYSNEDSSDEIATETDNNDTDDASDDTDDAYTEKINDKSIYNKDYDEDFEEQINNPVIASATNTIKKLLEENRKQRQLLDQQESEIDSLNSSNEILKEDNNSKTKEIISLRNTLGKFRRDNTDLLRENNHLKSISGRQEDVIEHLRKQNATLKEQVSGITALGNVVAEANTLFAPNDNNQEDDTKYSYLDGEEGNYQYSKKA